MLFVGTKLRPVDNTGVKQVKCIRIISKTKKYAQVGDLLGVVVKKFRMKKLLVKKVMYFGLVISMRARLRRIDGIWMWSKVNRIVLLSNKSQFLGTRIYGPIYKEVRNIFVGKGRYRRWKYDKVVSYAKKVI